jgi:hypothetical protein
MPSAPARQVPRPPFAALAGLAAALLLAPAAPPAAAAIVEVKLKLPVKARIDLEGYESVAVVPFLVVAQEGDEGSEEEVDVQAEFERYVRRLLARQTDLEVIEVERVDYPTYDLDVLSRNQDFWLALGERTGADLILTGSLDFDIQDRSGYRTEEYVSPYDGRHYYRQILVEQTGFEYDIVMTVVDTETGKPIYSDNFKDFKKFEGEKADPLKGMFENLYALEDRIAGIFAEKEVEVTRVLFTQ